MGFWGGTQTMVILSTSWCNESMNDEEGLSMFVQGAPHHVPNFVG